MAELQVIWYRMNVLMMLSIVPPLFLGCAVLPCNRSCLTEKEAERWPMAPLFAAHSALET